MNTDAKHVHCDLCLQDDEHLIATHYCRDCNKNICELHLQLHNKQKKLKDHNVKLLLITAPSSSTTTTTNTSIAINQNNQYCKQHQGQAIEVYCKDCDIAICLKCALFNHQLHKLIDIQQIIKEEQENVYKLLEILDSKKETLLQRNKNIEITINNLIEQVELNVNEIKKYIRDLHNAVENALEVLILKIYEIGDDKLRSLQNEQQLLKDHYESLNKVCELNNIDILQYKIKLENEIFNLNKLKVINNLDEINNLNVDIENDALYLIHLTKNKIANKDITRTEIKKDKLLFNTVNEAFNDTLQYKNNFELIKFELITKFSSQDNEQIDLPFDIIYNNNLIYIADQYNCRVLILDNSLQYKSELKLKFDPCSLAIHKEILYVGCSNIMNNIIYKINLKTFKLIDIIKTNKNYVLSYVYGLTTDKNGNLYICNSHCNEIIILNEKNELIKIFKINKKLYPKRITINSKDQLVITFENEIHIYDKLGNFIFNIEFKDSNLWGIIVDCNDNYIICDNRNCKLLLLDYNFKLIKEFTVDLKNPIGITVNENNQLYIAEQDGRCIKTFK